jgi:hypothetical protein
MSRLPNAEEILARERHTREAARAASQSVGERMIAQGQTAKVVRRVNAADPDAEPEYLIARPVTDEELAAIDAMPEEDE